MRRALAIAFAVLAGAAAVAGCGTGSATHSVSAPDGAPTIVVTFSVLGSLVEELVGSEANVTVLMPGGVDPHGWQPSAKDIETLESADLVVVNGLHFEQALEGALDEVESPVFRATDHVELRVEAGAEDPHVWTDPLAMKGVVAALAVELETALGLDVSARAAELEERLDALDAEVREIVAGLPPSGRRLVTGHESMGYFADRYGLRLVGAVVPSASSQAEASAGELAELAELIEREGVSVVFAEAGAPSRTAEAVAREAGARVVELPTHTLPADGSYLTFVRRLATTIARAAGS